MRRTKTLRLQQIKRVFKKNDVAIFFATNDNYCPQLAVMIESIIECSSKHHNYDIVILNETIDEQNVETIQSLKKDYKNISIRFVSIKDLIANIDFYTMSNYTSQTSYTKEAYFRLFIPLIAKNYKKVIYFDGDMVTTRDVYDLTNIDISKYYVAATRDYCGNASCFDEGSDRLKYRKKIGIKNMKDYFISSTIIFNLAKIHYSYDYIKAMIEKREWRQHDQDVLNVMFQDKVLLIDCRWSFLEVIDYPLKYLDKKLFQELIEASRNPYIIHYAAEKKPWIDNISTLTKYFWRYCYNTPYFNYFLQKIRNNIGYKCYIVNDIVTYPVNLVNYNNNFLVIKDNILLGTVSDINLTIEFIQFKKDKIVISGNYENISKEVKLLIECGSSTCNIDYASYHNSGIKFTRKITSFSAEILYSDILKNSCICFYFVCKNFKIVPKELSFGEFAPLNNNHLTFYNYKKFVLYHKKNCICFKHSSLLKRLTSEFKLSLYLYKKRNKYFRHIAFFRALNIFANLFATKRKCFINCSKYSNQELSMHLYKCIKKHNKHIKPYLITSNWKDYRMFKKRFNVLMFGTRKHKKLFVSCDKLISDVYDYRFFLPLFSRNNEIADIVSRKNMYFIDESADTHYFTKSLHNFEIIFFKDKDKCIKAKNNIDHNGYEKRQFVCYNGNDYEVIATNLLK